VGFVEITPPLTQFADVEGIAVERGRRLEPAAIGKAANRRTVRSTASLTNAPVAFG